MRHLLSTKVLSNREIRQLEGAGWHIDQYDAISIEFLKTAVTPDDHLLIFTSKNAVKAFFKSFSNRTYSACRSLCVGQGAAGVLAEKGVTVLEVFPSASELAGGLGERYAANSFVYYCGNMRLDLIPDTLDRLGLSWQEATVYRTVLNPRKWDREYEGVIFFSPSAVESYTALNLMGSATGYCIGKTTSATLGKYTHRILCPETPDRASLMDLLARPENKLT